jgi:hypothetical protein
MFEEFLKLWCYEALYSSIEYNDGRKDFGYAYGYFTNMMSHRMGDIEGILSEDQKRELIKMWTR